MHNTSFFVISLLAWLVANGVATIPHTLYRGDTRNPAIIKAAGGFKSKKATHKLGPGTLKDPSQNSYITTSSDISEARKKAGSKGYVYTIDTTGITGTFVDVAAEYDKLKKTSGYASEKEFAAYLTIPWANIVAAQEANTGRAVPLTRRDDVGDDIEDSAEDIEENSVPDWDNVYDREDGSVSDKQNVDTESRDNVLRSRQSDVGQVVQDETLAVVVPAVHVVRRVAKPLRV